MLTNRLMVKPMPHSKATPTVCCQLAESGNVATFNRTMIHTAPSTPVSLPASRSISPSRSAIA